MSPLPKAKNGKQVGLGAEIVFAATSKRQNRRRLNWSERCPAELRMNAEKRGDLESVHITDGPTASPQSSRSVSDSKSHQSFICSFSEGATAFMNVPAAREFRSHRRLLWRTRWSSDRTGLWAAHRGKEGAVSELLAGPVEQVIESGAIAVRPSW